MLWVLNLSDGEYSLLDTAERSNYEFGIIYEIARILFDHQSLKKVKN